MPVGVEVQAAGQDSAHLGAAEQRVAWVDLAGEVVGDEFQAAALAIEELRTAHYEAVRWPPGVADAVCQADVGSRGMEHPAASEFVGSAAGLGVQRHRESPAYRCPAVIAERLVGHDLGGQPESGGGCLDMVVQVELANSEVWFPPLGQVEHHDVEQAANGGESAQACSEGACEDSVRLGAGGDLGI